MTPRTGTLLASGLILLVGTPAAAQARRPLVEFDRIELSDAFRCEGASFGDFDRDGHGDVVAGPYWYAGPDFRERHEIYPDQTFDPLGYSDNFFAFPHDFDADGWLDVLFVGFPGQAATWYENPGPGGGPWTAHLAHGAVDNESPGFGDLTGDGRPELVFHTGGRLGWAGPDWDDPRAPWTFHPLSADLGLAVFEHGLGFGDVNGDGRADVLLKSGWWEQPVSLAGDPPWTHHPQVFSRRRGGAQMFAYDVDGDGDQDVITSLDAHGWGLSWFEQVRREGAIGFTEHRILDSRAEDNPYGVSFSQLHALDLIDVNGDGLKDLVTGKRWWAHGPSGDPGSEDPPVLYWLELRRSPQGGAEFVPRLIDADSGAGVQVVAGDVDADGAPDIVVANKKGAWVFLQRRSLVSAAEWERQQPARQLSGGGQEPGASFAGGVLPRGAGGEPLNLDFETGDLRDWHAEGGAFADQPVRGDTVEPRRGDMVSRHAGEFWIGGYEKHGDAPQGTLTSEPFRVTRPWGSFLVGGGRSRATRVELVRAADEMVLYMSPGADHETLQRIAVDLRSYLGQELRIRLVDENAGGWGHVSFDDFLLHESEPVIARDGRLPEIHPYMPLQETGLEPLAAARIMTAPAGFSVELVAGEPDLHQPIAMALDARGRLWVAEAHSYPVRRPEGDGLDQILVFEDADGDGAYENRTVFTEGLNLVSGMQVGFGGVWIGAAPHLLFIPDADGDLVPDGEPQILLDGWGYEDTHETLNAFIWGPDGWLYGCHGVFTHSRVGKPGTPPEERTPLNAGVWRYHPQRHEFEVFAWGTSNPWGVDFDDHGQAFLTACVIPHLYHVIQGARYQRQAGQHFGPHVYADIPTIGDHVHYTGDIGEHAWWGRNEPVAHASTDAAGGGHAHCGAMVYLGDNFPAEYRNTVFMGNIHGNRFNRDVPERRGSGFVGRHADDFLLANDQWFRPVNLTYGPDGGVFFIDWYDRNACHRTNPEVWDRSNGRLYKVRYGEPAPVRVALDRLTDLDLVGLQQHENDWYVRQARRLLQERGGSPAAHAALTDLLNSGAPTPVRLRALWALHVSGGLDEALGLQLLDDADESVQAWTVQLLLEDHAASPRLVEKLAALAGSTGSARVRLYLASALQRLPVADRWGIGTALAARGEDAGDLNLPLLVWYGVEPLVAADPARALAMARGARIPQVARFLVRRAAAESASHAALVEEIAAAASTDWQRLLLEETATALETRRGLATPPGWPAAYAALAVSGDTEIRERAFALAAAFGDASVFPELRAVLRDPAADPLRRERALDALLRGRDAALVPYLHALLDEPGLRGRAIRALAEFDDTATPAAVLARYGDYDEAQRRAALGTLAARASFARALLAAVEAGVLPRQDLDSVVVRQLRDLRDAEVDAMIVRTWGVYREAAADKAAEIERLKGVLAGPLLAAADLPAGRAAFARTCEQCHTLFGRGGDVGPDLTGSDRANIDYVLTNLVDPNAVIPKEYQVTVVETHGERILSGILLAETDSSLTLKDQNETVVVALDDIAERELSEVSMMPEDQLLDFEESELRDLLAYLASPVQTPLRATPANQSRFFNGTDLTGWTGNPDCWSVEDGAIVGRTQGLERNEFLRSELELGDFRLQVEVLLAGEQGNSGIQFRSREIEGGEVAGYQADVGTGWWGKLYEEHGRGLLEDDPGAVPLRPGAWNRYEILAVGTRVRTALNGHLCADLDDPAGALRGIVALQVHSGGPTEVRFRNLALELDPEDRLLTVGGQGR